MFVSMMQIFIYIKMGVVCFHHNKPIIPILMTIFLNQ